MVTPWGTREGALWHVGGDMPDMREGDLGTAACYLTVERLALQAGVESPFWDEASLLMGGCEEPWYKKPLTPRRLRLFLKRYGGSLADDAGRRGHAAFVFSDVMHLHGIPLGGGADGLGALYVRRAESVAMTVAFLATGCSFLDIAEVVDRSVAQVSKEIYDTWCEDYYIGCVDNIAKLAFDGYLVREQGLDEDGVEPGEVIVLEEYMEGVPQESRGLGTFDVHGV